MVEEGGVKAIADRPGWPRAAAASALMGAVSWAMAAVYVLLHAGFESGDLAAFGFWCALSGGVGFPVLLLFARWGRHRSTIATHLAAIVLGLLFGASWTYVVALLLGPWIQGFGFPVLEIWVGGAVAAFLFSVTSGAPGRWLASVGLWVVAIMAFATALGITAPKAAPDLIVVIAPGATAAEIEKVWQLFQAPSTPTLRTYNPEGVRSISAFDGDGEKRLRVTFHPGASPSGRAAVVQRAVASPLVVAVREIVEDDRGKLRERVIRDSTHP